LSRSVTETYSPYDRSSARRWEDSLSGPAAAPSGRRLPRRPGAGRRVAPEEPSASPLAGTLVGRAVTSGALDALASLGVGLLVTDPDLTVRACDAAAEQILGGRPEHVRDDGDPPAYEVVREDGTPWPLEERPLQAAALTGAVTPSVVLGLRDPTGTRWVRVSARPLTRGGPPPYAALCTFTDVTRERRRSSRLEASEARYRLLAEHSPDVIVRRSLDGAGLYCSPAAQEVFGRTPAQVLQEGLPGLVHPDDRAAAERLLSTLAETGEPQTLRHRALHRDGRVLWVETTGRAVPGPDGALEVQTSSRDVTRRVEAERRLSRLALADPLTGLANRAALLRRLDDLAAGRTCVAVLFLDLDRFKVVNDSLGHSAGDELLSQVASRLRGLGGPDVLAARLGGDEFALVVPDVGEEGALALAAVVHRALAEPLVVGEQSVVATASIGVVLAPGQAPPAAEVLLRDADVAMYQAKARGRATTVLWDERFGSAAVARLEVERDLRTALVDGQLVVHYQPQVELATGRVAGVEALVRWQHPQRGLLGPGAFLDVADDSGLVLELGTQVLAAAAAQVAAWRRLPGHDALALSVNVSAQELQRPERVDATLAVLEQTGLPPSAVTVEVLESVLLDAEGVVQASLAAYGALGVRLALDDFGTGATSLLHLRTVPFDTVKVDQAFVSGLGRCERDEAIVRALLKLTGDLRMRCVAEGVEQERQRQWLTGEGIGLAQGFLLSRPLPARAVERLLTVPPR
jgi:diguanylate cyclase (GGDEF)-like protein/PAS domain S-box-containing protein